MLLVIVPKSSWPGRPQTTRSPVVELAAVSPQRLGCAPPVVTDDRRPLCSAGSRAHGRGFPCSCARPPAHSSTRYCFGAGGACEARCGIRPSEAKSVCPQALTRRGPFFLRRPYPHLFANRCPPLSSIPIVSFENQQHRCRTLLCIIAGECTGACRSQGRPGKTWNTSPVLSTGPPTSCASDSRSWTSGKCTITKSSAISKPLTSYYEGHLSQFPCTPLCYHMATLRPLGSSMVSHQEVRTVRVLEGGSQHAL